MLSIMASQKMEVLVGGGSSLGPSSQRLNEINMGPIRQQSGVLNSTWELKVRVRVARHALFCFLARYAPLKGSRHKRSGIVGVLRRCSANIHIYANGIFLLLR
jgi:hypothetical protein